MDEVQRGQMDLHLPHNLPIPKGPWRNIRPMRSRYIHPLNTVGQDTTSEGSDIAVSPIDVLTGSGSHPADMVAESTSPTAVLTALAPPGYSSDLSASDHSKEEYYPSPVSSTGLDWEFSQDGSDHESSVDFMMSEDHEDTILSNSGSE